MNAWLEAEPSETASVVASRALMDRSAIVRRLLKKAVGEREKPEYVHQLRVWIRRTRAALALFAPLLRPKLTAKIDRSLRNLLRMAGRARDADIVLARLGASAPKAVRRDRAVAIDDFTAWRRERSERLRKRVKRLVERIRVDETPFVDFARARLTAAIALLDGVEASPDAPAEELHEFRKRAKRVRYAIELVAAAFPANAFDPVTTVLAELQDRLGAVNDAQNVLVRLERRARKAVRPAEVSELRRNAAEAHAQHLRARAEFQQWWPLGRQNLRAQLDRFRG